MIDWLTSYHNWHGSAFNWIHLVVWYEPRDIDISVGVLVQRDALSFSFGLGILEIECGIWRGWGE